mmetsp:Transcript_28884/g.77806  ORF Transcript_28884/g.77806 Transcript_28884/m.77806 type:complete len:333 (+) Transcript_28884:2200-3198(+)
MRVRPSCVAHSHGHTTLGRTCRSPACTPHGRCTGSCTPVQYVCCRWGLQGHPAGSLGASWGWLHCTSRQAQTRRHRSASSMTRAPPGPPWSSWGAHCSLGGLSTWLLRHSLASSHTWSHLGKSTPQHHRHTRLRISCAAKCPRSCSCRACVAPCCSTPASWAASSHPPCTQHGKCRCLYHSYTSPPHCSLDLNTPCSPVVVALQEQAAAASNLHTTSLLPAGSAVQGRQGPSLEPPSRQAWQQVRMWLPSSLLLPLLMEHGKLVGRAPGRSGSLCLCDSIVWSAHQCRLALGTEAAVGVHPLSSCCVPLAPFSAPLSTPTLAPLLAGELPRL